MISQFPSMPTTNPEPQVVAGPSGIAGTGLFATADFEPGDHVIEYVGERIGKEESDRRCEAQNPYIFNVDEQWDLDGNIPANPARFINHCCDPNCEAEQDDAGRIYIKARKPLRQGEELTFNYGYDLVDWEEHVCECRAANCLGFMVADEHVETIKGKLAEKAAEPVTEEAT